MAPLAPGRRRRSGSSAPASSRFSPPLALFTALALAGASGDGTSGANSAPSPCADRHADWVAEPGVFVRKDQPRHLQGLHIVCVWPAAAAARAGEAGGPHLLEAYRNAVYEGAPLRAELPQAATKSWKEFRQEVKRALGFRRETNNWGYLRLKQPFGIFSETGERVSSVKAALEAGLLLVAEGGQWFWPPMRVGYVRKLPGSEFELETLSVQPVIYRVRGFLRDEECTEIVKLGSGRMVNSPVSLMDKDKGKAAKEFRTSTQARVPSKESSMLRGIDDRIAKLTRVPVKHNEEVQILRYEKTQYYSAHLDNWDPAFYSGQDTSFMEHGHNNRLITVFWYLTDVSDGGETLFPRADGLAQPYDMYSCDQGLKVKPEKGAVIFWYSLHPNGNTDPNGLHAACPVKTGEKWSANYWVWNKPRGGNARQMPDTGVDDPDAEEERGEKEGGSPTRPDGQVVATFRNEHPAKAVHLFWQRPDGEEVYLNTIGPNGQTSMNTFPGHKCSVRVGQDPRSKKIRQFLISKEANQVHVVKAKAAKETDPPEQAQTDRAEI